VLVFWLSIVMALAGCTGLYLAAKGKWQGWAVGLAVQPVWAIFALVTKGYGLLVTCGMYGFVYYNNLMKWRNEQNKPIDDDAEMIKAGVMSLNEVRAYQSPPIIVAGTHRQAVDWCIDNGYDLRDVVIADSYQKLQGRRFRTRDVHMVGTWYERRDLLDIQQVIKHVTSLMPKEN
jgi:hypothetical protein